jgi:hypothetical protein
MAPEEQVELLEESQAAAASWPPAAWGRRDTTSGKIEQGPTASPASTATLAIWNL